MIVVKSMIVMGQILDGYRTEKKLQMLVWFKENNRKMQIEARNRKMIEGENYE